MISIYFILILLAGVANHTTMYNIVLCFGSPYHMQLNKFIVQKVYSTIFECTQAYDTFFEKKKCLKTHKVAKNQCINSDKRNIIYGIP